MTGKELYKLLLFNKGYNCFNCAHNTTDKVWKCDSKRINKNYVCERYMPDGLLKTMKLIDKELEENKNENK